MAARPTFEPQYFFLAGAETCHEKLPPLSGHIVPDL